MIDVLPGVVLHCEADGRFRACSRDFLMRFGARIARLQQLVHPADAWRLLRDPASEQVRHVRVHEGRWGWQLVVVHAGVAADRIIQFLPAVLPDAQLDQPRSAESCSQELLGQIVHSLNNYLSGVMGFTELAMLDVAPSHPAFGQLQTVLESGQQAIQFGDDLLATAARRVQQPSRVLWASVLGQFCQKQQIKPPMFHADTALSLDLRLLMRALDDLAAYARVGAHHLQLETQTLHLDSDAAARLQLIEGEYVGLLLAAPGEGLAAVHTDALFEPYYASRQVRGERGLGLSAAAGLIRQMGGRLCVWTEAGVGLAFLLLLPASAESAAPSPAKNAPDAFDGPQAGPDVWLLMSAGKAALVAQALSGFAVRLLPIDKADLQTLISARESTALLITEQLRDAERDQLLNGFPAPVLHWSPFAAHWPQGVAGRSVVQFDWRGERLRAAAQALLARVLV